MTEYRGPLAVLFTAVLAIALLRFVLVGDANTWIQFLGEIFGAGLAVAGAFWVGLRTARREAELAQKSALELWERRRTTDSEERREREKELRRALLREIELNLLLLDRARVHAQFGHLQTFAWQTALGMSHGERFLAAELQVAYADGSVYETSISLIPPMESRDHRTAWSQSTKDYAETAWKSFETAGRYLAKELGSTNWRAPTVKLRVPGNE